LLFVNSYISMTAVFREYFYTLLAACWKIWHGFVHLL
jgi:hypothetical protein